MPLPNTPVPAHPTVPQASGVPPLLNQIAQVQNTVVLLGADVAGVLALFQGPQWGLFNADGSPAFGATNAVIAVLFGSGQSVGEVEFRLDHRIATAPQAQGAFLSYNKVSTPFSGRVTYIVSGMEADRGAFLGAVMQVQNSLNLLTLIMPEITYPSCDVVHHDFRRTARNGLTMLTVDIWVEQVRTTGTAAFTNTASPSGASSVNNGTVQPYVPPPALAPIVTEQLPPPS